MMTETVVQVTLNVTVTTPDDAIITPLDLVRDGLKDTVIPVPSYVSSGYSIGRPVVKGIVEKD